MRYNIDRCQEFNCKYPHHAECRYEWRSIFRSYGINKGSLLKGNKNWLFGPLQDKYSSNEKMISKEDENIWDQEINIKNVNDGTANNQNSENGSSTI